MPITAVSYGTKPQILYCCQKLHILWDSLAEEREIFSLFFSILSLCLPPPPPNSMSAFVWEDNTRFSCVFITWKISCTLLLSHKVKLPILWPKKRNSYHLLSSNWSSNLRRCGSKQWTRWAQKESFSLSFSQNDQTSHEESRLRNLKLALENAFQCAMKMNT